MLRVNGSVENERGEVAPRRVRKNRPWYVRLSRCALVVINIKDKSVAPALTRAVSLGWMTRPTDKTGREKIKDPRYIQVLRYAVARGGNRRRSGTREGGGVRGGREGWNA